MGALNTQYKESVHLSVSLFFYLFLRGWIDTFMKAVTFLTLSLVLKQYSFPETLQHLNVQLHSLSNFVAVTRINVVASCLTNNSKVCLVLSYYVNLCNCVLITIIVLGQPTGFYWNFYCSHDWLWYIGISAHCGPHLVLSLSEFAIGNNKSEIVYIKPFVRNSLIKAYWGKNDAQGQQVFHNTTFHQFFMY